MTKTQVLPLMLALSTEVVPLQSGELPYTYDPRRQINVLNSTGHPAVDVHSLGTRTVTDTVESTDEDPTNESLISLGTQTMTKVGSESPDSDPDDGWIRAFSGTKTLTFVETEPTDED